MNVRQNFEKRTEPLISTDEMQALLAISSESDTEFSKEKKFNTHHFYMKFLMHSLTHSHKISNQRLGLSEQHILEKIAVCSEMGSPIVVNELCGMRQFGSSSNIHHIVHKLKELEMIYLQCSHDNGRMKLIRLAPKGVAYFQDVEDRIDMAFKTY